MRKRLRLDRVNSHLLISYVKTSLINSKILLTASALICLSLTSCSQQSANKDQQGSSAASSNHAEILHIAAAANLADVLPDIVSSYKTDRRLSKQGIEVTYGSSGKLFAQIKAGAPYDLFLSANQTYPAKLATEMAENNTTPKPFTYARGQLALYSVTKPVKPLKQSTLTSVLMASPKSKVAIANPKLAPYGASAKAYLQSQQLFESLTSQNRLIQAENIGQAFQYTHSGNVDYGLVAQSQMLAIQASAEQFVTLSPEDYPPILQDGVVITDAPVATDFAEYLQSAQGQQLLERAGYLPVKQPN